MATKTTSSTLFRPELTQEIFNKVKGHSTLAKLSRTVPMPFADTETFVFTMDGEAAIVGEGGNKPAGEANISLYWYKKISIEELIINGNCTFFASRDFIRHIYSGILFFDNRNFIRDKTGETKNGSLDIQIYGVNNTDSEWFPKVGDYVVPEIYDFEFNTSDEQKISESMADFRKKYNNFAVVNSIEKRFSDVSPDLIISSR